MKHRGGGTALAWLATGAVMLAAGVVLGSGGRRREFRPVRESEPGDNTTDDLADRPVARAALADALAAARRVDQVAASVSSLERRVGSIEHSSAKVDALWDKVIALERQLEEVRSRVMGPAFAESVIAQAQERIGPRVAALEAKVDEHQTAIRELQSHAAQTEVNLQKMIAAVEKLTDQLSRSLPARIEPQKETTASAPEAEAEKGFRWKSIALIAAAGFGLLGSYATVRYADVPRAEAAVVAPSPGPDRLLGTAIHSLTAVADQDPQNVGIRYELGRLNELRETWTEAERWYRQALAEDPHHQRALNALADLLRRERR